MKNIAIICAPPHGEFNPGMHSVDLGAYSFFNRHKFTTDINTSFFLLHEPEPSLNDFLKNQLPFKYTLFLNELEQLYQYDLIIYWGDFFHNAPFNRGLSKRLVRYNIADDEADAIKIIQKHFFLSEAPIKILEKTIVFGSNYFINGTKDLLNEEFASHSIRFFSNIKRVWNRDILSAIRMSHMKKDYTTNFLGVDCSFLFDKQTKNVTNTKNKGWLQSLLGNTGKLKTGLFLGRMHNVLEQMIPFVNELNLELNNNIEWIPWFWQNEDFYNRIRKEIKGITVLPEYKNLMELYDLLYKYDFIITDTYHLCLNAWKMGIPAICIGSGSSLLDSALTDKKKEIFFNMYEAQDFYVYLEEVNDPEKRLTKIKALEELIRTPKIIEQITRNIHQHRDTIENDLYETINQHLINY